MWTSGQDRRGRGGWRLTSRCDYRSDGCFSIRDYVHPGSGASDRDCREHYCAYAYGAVHDVGGYGNFGIGVQQLLISGRTIIANALAKFADFMTTYFPRQRHDVRGCGSLSPVGYRK